ncbi:unnamed protein product [Clonostachys chloroleuca]|uniref:Uncharacterized protein n=1 Tax=Clonostachys chloroleuca TaxID=1926264 RepID=A0AA35LSW9_9HYPO|nr:unnamed protein product [Clonostachys chloroleuca]
MPIEYKQGGFANQSAELPQVAPNVRAFMKGYFRLEKDKKQFIVYEFDEVKCFIEGECTISDEVGTKVTVHAGDISTKAPQPRFNAKVIPVHWQSIVCSDLECDLGTFS